MATLAGERFHLTVVEDIESLPPSGDWNLLAELAGSPFLTAEWLTAWWGAFGSGRLSWLLLGDRHGSLRAGACCRRLTGGRLAAAANEHTGDWDAVATDEQAREALWRAVAGLGAGAVDLAAIRNRHSRQQAAQALSAAGYRTVEVTGVRSPYLELPGTWEDLLASVSRNLRSQLGRRRRGLEREGRLRFRTSAATGEELERDLAAFLRVEASGWKSGSGTAILSDPRTTRLYTQFAKAAAAAGWLRLHLLELDGVPVAADLNCRFAGGSFLIKTGYDERYAAFSPGLVLRGEVLRAAIEEGADFYDFLGGPDSYKLRWTAELRPRVAVKAYRGVWRPLGTYHARLRPLLKAGVLQARSLRAELARRRQERRKAGSP
jgi:CelD/BcsL family acetyltransferase involved in cellulose biosynthesis